MTELLHDDLREACRLFGRGGVTRRELNAMCVRLRIDSRAWRAVYDEWNGSDRMRRRDSQFWNGSRWVSLLDNAHERP